MSMFSHIITDRARLVPIILSQCVGLACGILGVKLSTRWIAPTDYGYYGVFLGFTPLGMWAVHAGLIKFVLRRWNEDDQAPLWAGVTRAAWRRLPWLALAAAGAALLVGGRSGWTVFPFIFGAATALSFGTLAQSGLQASRQHWRDFVVNLAASASRSFLPPLLYMATGAGVFALYSGYLGHTLVFAAIAVIALRPNFRSLTGRGCPQLTDTYAGPLFTLLAAVGWLLSGINRWLVAAFEGHQVAGYFTLAAALAAIVPATVNAVGIQFAQPLLFAMPTGTVEERCRLARRADQAAVLSWLLSMAGLSALRSLLPWLVGPLVDAKYLPALDYVLPAGCFFVAAATTGYYDILLMAAKRERACGPVDLATSATLILGGLLAAWIGPQCFKFWLLATAVLPWLLSRPLARSYYFRSAPA